MIPRFFCYFTILSDINTVTTYTPVSVSDPSAPSPASR
nr:MAG TPA: hypothetical protein [Caudoviricetes sp.]